jgi:hypothetical protein
LSHSHAKGELKERKTSRRRITPGKRKEKSTKERYLSGREQNIEKETRENVRAPKKAGLSLVTVYISWKRNSPPPHGRVYLFNNNRYYVTEHIW